MSIPRRRRGYTFQGPSHKALDTPVRPDIPGTFRGFYEVHTVPWYPSGMGSDIVELSAEKGRISFMLSFSDYVISAVFQLIVFSLIPLVWWLLTARKKAGFFAWIGLRKPAAPDRKGWLLPTLAVFVVCFAVGQLVVLLIGDLDAAADFVGMGAWAVPSIVVYSFVQTALSEEILFRGFLLKRLAGKLGFWGANFIQAALFGAAHLLVGFTTEISLLAGVVILVYPIFDAMLMGWLNEKRSGGSILPGWLIHGCLNCLERLLLIL